MKEWKKNLYSVSFAETIRMTAMSFMVPFLPLYLRELGITEVSQIAHWSGWIIAAPAIAMVFLSPIWGSLADRFGRKLIIEFAFLGTAISIFLMFMASNVYQLLFLRLLQGALSGTTAASKALISSCSPAKKLGSCIGLLQTGSFLGNFLGPLMGGVFSDIFGLQNSFKVTASLLFFSGCLIFFLVKEDFVPCSIKKNKIPFNKKIKYIAQQKQLIIMLILLFLLQFAIKSITPIFSLFVENMVTNKNTVSTTIGLMFALTGLAAAISSVKIGKYFDKNPSYSTLIMGFIGTGILFFSQGFIVNLKQLALLRICIGICYGAIIPIANTMIVLFTPSQNRGKVFGISTSTTFLGNIFGPIVGGLILTFSNISSVFFFTGGLLLSAGLTLPIILKNSEYSFFEIQREHKLKDYKI